jgi:hypothetical protein
MKYNLGYQYAVSHLNNFPCLRANDLSLSPSILLSGYKMAHKTKVKSQYR